MTTPTFSNYAELTKVEGITATGETAPATDNKREAALQRIRRGTTLYLALYRRIVQAGEHLENVARADAGHWERAIVEVLDLADDLRDAGLLPQASVDGLVEEAAWNAKHAGREDLVLEWTSRPRS